MIIVFTSNEKGGLIQLAITVTEELHKLGRNVRCFIPTIANASIPEYLQYCVIRYEKTKSPNPYNTKAKNVASQLQMFNPRLVWYVDNGIFSSQVGINLAGRVMQALIMHDAGTSHSSFNTSFRQRLKLFIENMTSELCNKKIDWIITCSPNSKTVYSQLYPSQRDKVYMLPLGPHMPKGACFCPPEVEGVSDYFLFFGRIDKYKGIDILLSSYSKWSGSRKLVIAGSGQLQSDETYMANVDSRVILINRFIKDEEMPYLFKNARAVILPYKDATQSGILPIAYMCGKPIICSDVIGISQFVDEGMTGCICKSESDYVKAYNLLKDNECLSNMSDHSRNYYKKYLDWNTNIKQMLLDFHV